MPKWGSRVPKPHFHKASGQARLKVDGREIWLGKWDSAEARRKYKDFLREWAEAKAAGPAMEPERPTTVSVAIFRFWQWAEARYRGPDGKPTREADNLRNALRPLRKLFGELPLAEFGPAKLYQVQDAMVDSGLARKTVNARVNKVRRFVRWCVGRELCPATVASALAAVEPLRAGQGVRESPGRRAVAWEAVEATLPHMPEMLRVLVRVLWHTGARVGEVERLATGMIDRSGEVWKATLDEHKNAHRGHERVILLGPEAIEAIRPWLRPGEPDEPIFSPLRSDPRQANRRGKRLPGRRYGRSSLTQAIRRACRRAFPHPTLSGRPADDLGPEELAELKAWQRGHAWSLAQLRHSRATTLRERFGLDVAQVVLGHSKPTTTAGYSKAAIAHAVEAMREAG